MSAGLLIDTTRCIACGACSAACKEQNELPLPVEAKTTAYTWTTVETHDGVHVRRLCMHCAEPTCVSVCPVAALSKTPEGPVVYDGARCIGCRYCIMACPFSVPKYQWDRAIPVMGKCIMCHPRVKAGQPTACAAVCPTGATFFGDRDALVREAHRRIATTPASYVDHLYGEEEAGGTSVMLLASVPFEQLGLKTSLPRQPLPLLTWQVMSRIPDFVVVAGVFLYGLHWMTRRREEVHAATMAALPAAAPAAGNPDGGGAPGALRRWLSGTGRRS